MKKILLTLGAFACLSGAAMAQGKKNAKKPAPAAMEQAIPAASATAATTATLAVPANPLVFQHESHDFGTVQEGPAAEYKFSFKNSAKEPLIIKRVQASCGCTTPNWTKEPVLPGKNGDVTASYGTAGRPGNFNKTLTVFYTLGSSDKEETKVLTITGNVDRAPATSVPENNSLIKTN